MATQKSTSEVRVIRLSNSHCVDSLRTYFRGLLRWTWYSIGHMHNVHTRHLYIHTRHLYINAKCTLALPSHFSDDGSCWLDGVLWTAHMVHNSVQSLVDYFEYPFCRHQPLYWLLCWAKTFSLIEIPFVGAQNSNGGNILANVTIPNCYRGAVVSRRACFQAVTSCYGDYAVMRNQSELICGVRAFLANYLVKFRFCF